MAENTYSERVQLEKDAKSAEELKDGYSSAAKPLLKLGALYIGLRGLGAVLGIGPEIDLLADIADTGPTASQISDALAVVVTYAGSLFGMSSMIVSPDARRARRNLNNYLATQN